MSLHCLLRCHAFFCAYIIYCFNFPPPSHPVPPTTTKITMPPPDIAPTVAGETEEPWRHCQPPRVSSSSARIFYTDRFWCFTTPHPLLLPRCDHYYDKDNHNARDWGVCDQCSIVQSNGPVASAAPLVQLPRG